MKTVTVDAQALRQVLEAFMGPPHILRELLVIYEFNKKFPMEGNDPIGTLIAEYNAAAEAYNVLEKARQTDENS